MRERLPVVAWFVVATAALAALGNLGSFLAALRGLRDFAVGQVIGTMLVSIALLLLSGFVAVRLAERKFRSRTPVSAYLWLLLLSYPATNLLRASGWYLPQPPIPSQLLAGAAMFELLRYVWLLALIVWVSGSKAMKGDLRDGAQSASDSPT